MESISPITVALPFAVYLIGWYACFHIALRGRRILRPLAIIPTLIFAIAVPVLLTDLFVMWNRNAEAFTLVWMVMPLIILISFEIHRRFNRKKTNTAEQGAAANP